MYKRNNFIYFKNFQFIIFSLSSFFFLFYNLLEWMDNSIKQNKTKLDPEKKINKEKKTKNNIIYYIIKVGLRNHGCTKWLLNCRNFFEIFKK